MMGMTPAQIAAARLPPDSVHLRGWLDTDDLPSIYIDGALVDSARNKGTLGGTWVRTGDVYLDVDGGPNGRPCITWEASGTAYHHLESSLTIDDWEWVLLSPSTVYVLCRRDNNAGFGYAAVVTTKNTITTADKGAVGWIDSRSSEGRLRLMIRDDSAAVIDLNSAVVSATDGAWHALSWASDYSVTPELSTQRDGTQWTHDVTDGARTPAAVAPLRIGGQCFRSTMMVSQVLVYEGAHDDVTRARVEAWLAHRAGGSLPA